MKIAITGGTPFVGRHLAEYLISLGHEAILLARGFDRRHAPAARVIATDLSDAGVLVEAIRDATQSPIAQASTARFVGKPIGAFISRAPGTSLRPPGSPPFRAFSC